MEDIYPEIALKHPKADPRTVLLHNRNFMESSSDHIQEEFFKKFSYHLTKTTAKCDKLRKIYENSSSATATTTTTTTLVFKQSLVSSLLSTTSSSSLLSTILVKFSKSCHFNASFNNLYKLQKTKLLFFLLFIWCAILLQTTSAIPVRRTTTSGRKLILHTNVYRDHYHQKLLEEQRKHNKQQQLLQIQQQQLKQIQDQQQQQLKLPQQHQLPVQKNHIYSPTKILRRTQPQHHHHHLHQRAAPSTITTSLSSSQIQYKMSYCNGNTLVYQNLHTQVNRSLEYIKQLCSKYLRDRNNDTFDSLSKTWKLISLETRNPLRKPVSMDNELHKEIHDFYLNLHNFDQLIDYASQDTNDNRTRIEHGEDISIDKIISFFQSVKAQIKFNMNEADNLLEILAIEKPNLQDNIIEFDTTIGRRVRDFLIIKNLIEEFERISQMVQNYCENNNQE